MLGLFILLGIIWHIVGAWGFIYWWSKDFDVTTEELPLAFIMGFIGPLAWITGYFIHRPKRNAAILIPRRLK